MQLLKTKESNTTSTISCEVRPIHHHNMTRQSILGKGSYKAYHCNDKSVSGSGRNTHSIRTRIPQLTTRGVRDDIACNSRKLSATRSTSIFRDSGNKMNLGLYTPISSLAAAYMYVKSFYFNTMYHHAHLSIKQMNCGSFEELLNYLSPDWITFARLYLKDTSK